MKNNKCGAIRMQNQHAFQTIEEPLEYGSTLTYTELCNKLLSMQTLATNTNISILINGAELAKEDSYTFHVVGDVPVKVILTYSYEYTVITKQVKTLENTKDFTFVVEDTKVPVLSGISDKEITVGDDIELGLGITAEDEIDGNLEVQIEGNVDNQKAGEYTIKVTATDRNGNIAEQTFTVTVKEKPVEKQASTKTDTKTNVKTDTSDKTTSNKTNTATGTQTEEPVDDTSTKAGRLKLATAEAKRVVGQITNASMNAETKAKAICNYLYRNVDRQTNQSNEAYKTNFGNEAYAALILKKAACSGFCKAVTLMCNAAGLQSKHINANSWTHQWNTVLIDGEWIILDAQINLVGGTTHPLEY